VGWCCGGNEGLQLGGRGLFEPGRMALGSRKPSSSVMKPASIKGREAKFIPNMKEILKHLSTLRNRMILDKKKKPLKLRV